MASADEQLPEGTDAIIEGAGVSGKASEKPAVSAILPGGDAKAAFYDRVDTLRGQATDKARDYALLGKGHALSALDGLVGTVEAAAADIDEKLGPQYGDYARRAAQGIGDFSNSFRDKDVDELFADARAFVQRSPAVAIGAAAAIGFVVARLARAALPETPGDDAPKA